MACRTRWWCFLPGMRQARLRPVNRTCLGGPVAEASYGFRLKTLLRPDIVQSRSKSTGFNRKS